MRITPHSLSLACAGAITAATVLASVACAQTTAPAPQSAPPIATVNTAPAPELVTGLPDFTKLVERVGPGVVSVATETSGRARTVVQRNGQPMPDMDQLPEFFRRMVPDGMPTPDNAPAPRGRGMGTGFVISPDGYLLTNHHVIDGADKVTVRMADRREFPAKVVGSDPSSDVALLKIDASGLPALRIGNSSLIKPGQWVVAIGSPLGLEHSVTAGIVSAVGRSANDPDQRYVPFIQTDVAINRGNSGGPLLNTRGEVVGINSQIMSMSGGYMGLSFAIPIDMAMNAANQLRATGTVRRGALGVNIRGLAQDDAAAINLPDTRGALVTDFPPDSAGARAGLQRLDVIRSVDGRPVNDSADLPPIIGAMAPGTRVVLEVWRDGRIVKLPVTLGQLDQPQAAAMPARVGAPGATPAPATVAAPFGLTVRDLDAAQRHQLGLAADEGVLIAATSGPAAAARLRTGDVVLAVGRNAVRSAAQLQAQLRQVPAQRPVMLLVRRGGTSQYVTLSPDAQ